MKHLIGNKLNPKIYPTEENVEDEAGGVESPVESTGYGVESDKEDIDDSIEYASRADVLASAEKIIDQYDEEFRKLAE